MFWLCTSNAAGLHAINTCFESLCRQHSQGGSVASHNGSCLAIFFVSATTHFKGWYNFFLIAIACFLQSLDYRFYIWTIYIQYVIYVIAWCTRSRKVGGGWSSTVKVWTSAVDCGQVNPLSPHDALKHHFTSMKTDWIYQQPRFSERKSPWNWFTNTWQFSLIFKSNHLHPLQVENCDSNSRLVVDEDDNVKLGLTGLGLS